MCEFYVISLLNGKFSNVFCAVHNGVNQKVIINIYNFINEILFTINIKFMSIMISNNNFKRHTVQYDKNKNIKCVSTRFSITQLLSKHTKRY